MPAFSFSVFVGPLVACLVVGLAACSTTAARSEPSYGSVRERLAEDSTRLWIGGADPAGTVVARRWTREGWIDGVQLIGIDRGELSVSVDGALDELTLSTLEVSIAPVEIPIAVFETSAQLTDLRLSLRAPIRCAARWNGDDELASLGSVLLDLDWALMIDGAKTPLGTQHLPPIALDVAISGSGDVVEASLGLAAGGELWNWVGLLKLVQLELALDAATVD